MNKDKKLDKIIDQLILDLDSIGFDISGDKVGTSIVLEITEKEYFRENFKNEINDKNGFS